MKTVKVKVNKPFKNYRKGQIIEVMMNDKGVPINLYMRKRFQDAEIDQCLEVVKDVPEEKSVVSEPMNAEAAISEVKPVKPQKESKKKS
jgi:TusA-related sulfurtransferase